MIFQKHFENRVICNMLQSKLNKGLTCLKISLFCADNGSKVHGLRSMPMIPSQTAGYKCFRCRGEVPLVVPEKNTIRTIICLPDKHLAHQSHSGP